MDSFLINQQALACNFIKKKIQHRCFPVNIVKVLRTAFVKNTSGDCFCVSLWLVSRPCTNTSFNAFQYSVSSVYETLCAICHHLYNLNKVRNTNGGVLLLVKLQAEVCNFTKNMTPPWISHQASLTHLEAC